MSIVRVKTKYQVTLPSFIRKQAGIKVGDILDAKVEKGQIVFTFKDIVDRRLALAMEDVRMGRVSPAFDNVEDTINYLKKKTKKHR